MKANEQKIVVLFVDDELYQDEITKYSCKIKELEKDGDMRVDVARDGTTALEYLREQTPDIIVLDIMMPPGKELIEEEINEGRHTGFAFLRVLSAERALDIPVIILTVYPKTPAESEIRKWNVVEYLSKPVLMSKLAELVRYYVREKVKEADDEDI